MTRLLLAIASFALAIGAVAAAATSLSLGSVKAPAQGTISVLGACVETATVGYTYVGTDGTTGVSASSGDADYVKSIVVTRTSGPSTCVGTSAAIRFENTSATAPALEVGAENPAFVGDASNGSWTFLLDTTSGTSSLNNKVADWSTGSSITVTVH